LPSLPITPGVYIFKNRLGRVIYVGKANNLRKRISWYFKSPVKLGPKTAKLVANISTVDFINVNSEIEALLLESRLIKKFKPYYNLISKDDKSPYYVHITLELFPKPVINHSPQNSLAGPFMNGLIPRKILKSFRPVTPFCSSPRPIKKPCFYSHLGLCRPCPDFGSSKEIINIYHQNILRLKKLLKGGFTSVSSSLKKEMVMATKKQDYERAAKFRDQLASLSFLLSSPVRPEEYISNPNLIDDRRREAISDLQTVLKPFIPNLGDLFRIEAYDISHLSGTFATAAMVVSQNGYMKTDLYRHFNIRYSQSDSDTAMMSEVITRRFHHPDWPKPDLLLLDGGIPQLSSVLALTSVQIPPVISLSKQSETINVYVNGRYTEINLQKDNPALLFLMNLRDEAHRFCRRLHHHGRAKIILS
jgi:excinuclease ABC subunit C